MALPRRGDARRGPDGGLLVHDGNSWRPARWHVFKCDGRWYVALVTKDYAFARADHHIVARARTWRRALWLVEPLAACECEYLATKMEP